MIVIEGATPEGRGRYRIPLDKEMDLIIQRILDRTPIFEIEIDRRVKLPKPAKKTLINAARKHNVLLGKAKTLAKQYLTLREKVKSSPTPPPNKVIVKLKKLEQDLKRLKSLLDKYEKICKMKVAFVPREYLQQTVPLNIDLSLINNPDFLQVVAILLSNH